MLTYEKLKTTPRNSSGDLFCRKCEKFLCREIDGGVYLLASGIRLYGVVKFSCHTCLKNYRFQERPPKRDPIPEESYPILNSLGREEDQKNP